MKVTIVEDPNVSETEISVVCAQMTEEVKEIVARLTSVGLTFAGQKENEIFFVPIKDIFYFESVEGSIFFYTERDTYEATEKLYSIEENLRRQQFARISKTVIANLDKMLSIKRVEGSRLVATLVNKEKLVVSRKYVPEIKKKLGV